MEGAVGVVEFAVLELQEVGGEGLDADEPVEGESGGGVVGAVVEGRDVRVVPVLVAFDEGLATARVEGA